MARHTQDIPIRPRYGIVDVPDSGDSATNSAVTLGEALPVVQANANTYTNASELQPQSYSEIPFLAQYSDLGNPQYDVTPTTPTVLPLNRDDSLEADDNSMEMENEEESSNSSSHNHNASANKTPKSLADSSFPYELEEGEMRHFVAENLEKKLRTASPMGKRDSSGFAAQNTTGLLTRHFLQTQMPQVDANLLAYIEVEAQYLATSVDNLKENLFNLLHSISSITADNVEVHKNAVNKLTDSMDSNIKCMYTIMAKTEEISNSMKPTEHLGQRIREIKRLVDMLDNTM